MTDNLNLSMHQRQQQKLLPQQVRFGRLLEMSGPEVEDEVRKMLDENPALDVSDGHDNDTFNETSEQIQLADYASEDDIPPITPTRYPGGGYEDSYYDAVVSDDAEGLTGILEAQLPDLNLDETQLLIAKYIIGSLDENGYLERGVRSITNDIEQHTGTILNDADVTDVLDKVRTLEPAGVGAKDLQQCLSLQLLRSDADDVTAANARRIIDEYFDHFSLKHYQQLAQLMGISDDDLKAAIARIRSLNPKPGASYNISRHEQRTNYVIPDFAVDSEGNKLTISALNQLPELAIETSFTSDAESNSGSHNDTRQFIRQKREDAQTFIDLLRLRQSTLMSVMQAIVRIQSQFFLSGDGDKSLLKPMILRDISDMTGLDQSVISRATANKYVSTASGVYPLKMFFNERFNDTGSSVSPDRDNEISSHAILEAIKSIIDGEDKSRPLSDEIISDSLRRQGFDVARRTVAKYRERLGYPVARLRRTFG